MRCQLVLKSARTPPRTRVLPSAVLRYCFTIWVSEHPSRQQRGGGDAGGREELRRLLGSVSEPVGELGGSVWTTFFALVLAHGAGFQESSVHSTPLTAACRPL